MELKVIQPLFRGETDGELVSAQMRWVIRAGDGNAQVAAQPERVPQVGSQPAPNRFEFFRPSGMPASKVTLAR